MLTILARHWGRSCLCFMIAVFLAGCAEMEPRPMKPSDGHLRPDDVPMPSTDTIPDLVQQTPILPEPGPAVPMEKYTVVVNEVPVRELLFALARDADMNIDIYPGIEGLVTLNAVDATLPKILDRISRQVDIRYEFDDDTLIISPDEPFFRSYRIDYVNMMRDTTATNRIATQISTAGTAPAGTGTGAGAGGGGGGRGGMNTATTDIESLTYHRFWQTLVTNVSGIIGDELGTRGARDGEVPITANVIASPETGLLNVRANSKQHALIREHVDRMVESAQRQVLIQATIVEVTLRDEYQAGINWEALDIAGSSISIISRTLPTAAPVAGPLMTLRYDGTDISSVIRLLEEFGATNVLSSPQAMVLNNQTAVLKAVTNVVYFELRADTTSTQTTALTTVNTETRTVPEGVVMAVTPQISSDGTVTLNVRPTVSRISRFVPDPSIALIQAQFAQAGGVIGDVDIPPNEVPEMEVREMESMLRLFDGQTAILGGLMQDETLEGTDAIPGLSRIPFLGRAFRTDTRQYRKSELVVFLRPVIVRTPSLSADLEDYRPVLERSVGAPGRSPGGSAR